MGPQLSNILFYKLIKLESFYVIGQKMECDVKADDKFCVNIAYKNEEDEKFYVKISRKFVDCALFSSRDSAIS